MSGENPGHALAPANSDQRSFNKSSTLNAPAAADFGHQAPDLPTSDLSTVMFGNLIETAAEATGLAHVTDGDISLSSTSSSLRVPCQALSLIHI